MRLASALMACVVLGTVVLGGCSTSKPGTPESTTVAPSSTTSVVPAVANPLDVTQIQKSPCDVFTNTQLAQYMGEVRKTNTDSSGGDPSCMWYPSDGHKTTISVIAYPDLGGPAKMYELKAQYNFFEKAGPISGYPAVHASNGDSQVALCQTIVSVSDKAGFGILVNNTTE
ncbi:MAG: DUF3558 domain-containing protein [Kutzneria sp.]|nr:DUF3558 domain-containing protein [Kutzneria sp.]MBV9847823.1 DUF3558 domain-containing protein [Kutzneria sp.]